MNRNLKLALAALLGFSAACTSVKNAPKEDTAKTQGADTTAVKGSPEFPRRVVPGDPRQARQCAGTDRCFGPAEPFQNGFSALRCIHGFQSFLSALRYYALIVAKDGGSCKNAFTFPAAGW